MCGPIPNVLNGDIWCSILKLQSLIRFLGLFGSARSLNIVIFFKESDLSVPEPRIERIPKSIADKVIGHDGQEDRESRKNGKPPGMNVISGHR